MAKCPFCEKSAETKRGLKKHLTGGAKWGGHDKGEMVAEEIADQVFAGIFGAAASVVRSIAPIAAQAMMPKLPVSGVAPMHHVNSLADPYASFLTRLFESLVANKRLPKYQFERRVDAMLMIFVPGILRELHGWNVELVAPEFPLRKSTNNQSTNVDHLLFRHADDAGNNAAWVFFELKTDVASCNDLQLETYHAALAMGMPKLLSDLRLITAKTNAGAKYGALTKRLAKFPEDVPIELVYLAPCRVQVAHARAFAVTFQDLEALSLPEFPEVWDLFRRTVLPALRS